MSAIEPIRPTGQEHGPDAATASLESDSCLWTAKDVARYLRASVSWVYQKAEAGLLPCLPRLPGSNLLRFDPAVVKGYARGEWRPNSVVAPSRSRRR
jgi:hypothetical protein